MKVFINEFQIVEFVLRYMIMPFATPLNICVVKELSTFPYTRKLA